MIRRKGALALAAAFSAPAPFALPGEARALPEARSPGETAVVAKACVHVQRWKTVTKSRTVTDEAELRVRINYGAGILRVRPGTDDNLLYQARMRFDEDAVRPEMDYENGRFRVGFSKLEGARSRKLEWEGREDKLDLRLPITVPVDIDVDFGAGRAELDLSGVHVDRLDLSTGASESVVRINEPNPIAAESAVFEIGAADFRVSGLGNLNAKRIAVRAGVGAVTLDLRGSWEAEARLVVDMGLGALTLQVPESLGVRVRRDAPRFLASFDLDGMVKRADGHYSLNWDDAERKLDIEITAALGSVDLRWVP